MKKFWEWMESKGYGSKIDGLYWLENRQPQDRQMLIGYFREFLGYDINKEYDKLKSEITNACI